MLVLGIDPGTRFLGWGLVQGTGNRLAHVAHGVVRAGEKGPLAARLLRLDIELSAIVELYKPEYGAVESLFFHKDPQAAAKLGHARGVVLLTLERAGVGIAEYAPARVKSMLTGSGRAEKIQVANMVRTLLGLSAVPQSDAADALALAVTHLRRAPIDARLTPPSGRVGNTALVEALKSGGRRSVRRTRSSTI